MFEIKVDGRIHSQEEITSYDENCQVELMVKWFNENYEYVEFDDIEKFKSANHYRVEPELELVDVFSHMIEHAAIEQAAEKITPINDDVFIPNNSLC